MTIYDLTVKDAFGKDIALSDYRGQVLLIVNTATGCGFTPQYEQLQTLYEKYKTEGFAVLDFPCNQFGGQAPGSDEEISQFCTLNYNTTFPRFAKTHVNGPDVSPLFRYLTENTTFAGFPPQHQLSALLDNMLAGVDPDYRSKSDIKWNFTKFLIDRNGKIAERFEPTHEGDDIERKIAALIK